MFHCPPVHHGNPFEIHGFLEWHFRATCAWWVTIYLALRPIIFNSRTHAGYHCETFFPIGFTAQFDFAASDIFVRENVDCIVGTARGIHLSTRHLDLCWDKPISRSQRCRMHIFLLLKNRIGNVGSKVTKRQRRWTNSNAVQKFQRFNVLWLL